LVEEKLLTCFDVFQQFIRHDTNAGSRVPTLLKTIMLTSRHDAHGIEDNII